MASRHAADRSPLDRDANRVRDLPNNKARNLPQCPAFPGFDIFTENFFNEGSPDRLHFVPGTRRETEPAAATIKPDIGVSDHDVLTTPPRGLTAHGQVLHDQYPSTPELERHPPGFLSESPAPKQATQLEELLDHSMPRMFLSDLEKVKLQLMIARDSATIKSIINSFTGWKLPVPELMQRCCAILDIDNLPSKSPNMDLSPSAPSGFESNTRNAHHGSANTSIEGQYPSSVISPDMYKPPTSDGPSIKAPQSISPAPRDHILSSITYPPPRPHTPILPLPSSISTHSSPSDNITSGKRLAISKQGSFLLDGTSHHFMWSLSEGRAAMSSPPSDPLCIPAVGDLHLHINTTLEQTKANCQCWMYYGSHFGWRDITQGWISNNGSVTHPLYSSRILHRQPNRLNPNYIINPADRSRSKSPSIIIAPNPQNMSLPP